MQRDSVKMPTDIVQFLNDNNIDVPKTLRAAQTPANAKKDVFEFAELGGDVCQSDSQFDSEQ